METIEEWRGEVGLTAPIPEEKRYAWSKVTLRSAETPITKETGGYKPNTLIEHALLHPATSKLLTGGPRSGKSVGIAMDGLAWLPHSNLIWLVADTYAGTRREFRYLLEGAESLSYIKPDTVTLSRAKDKPSSFETKWGCVVETMSLVDERRIAAYGPDVIIVCEPGLISKDVVWRFRERLSGRRGYLLMGGSFEHDSGWMIDLAEEWKKWPRSEGKFFLVPSWTNRALYPGGKHDPAIEKMRRNMSRYEFLLRVAGTPTMPPEIIFGEHFPRDARKTPNIEPFDAKSILQNPNIVVELCVDPGYSDGFYAVHPIAWDGKQAHVFDEIRMQGATHEQVISVALSRWWWYRVSGGTLDPWAGTHHIFGSSSPQEVWQREAHIRLRCDFRLGVEDAIERHVWFLRDRTTGETRLLVDPCAVGLLGEYRSWKRKKVPEGTDRTKEPQKTGCDSIKAVSGWLVDCYMRRMRVPQVQKGPTSTPMKYTGPKARWFPD